MPLSALAQIDQAKPAAPTPPQPPPPPTRTPACLAKPGPHPASLDDDLAAMQLATARYSAQDRTAFVRGLDLSAFRLLSVQHNDQIKIMDSWARQCLRKIAHTETLEGRDCLYTALDMAIRSPYWMNKNIIYIESVPIREELGFFAGNPAEAQRIRLEARVSPSFLLQPQVRDRLKELSLDSRQLSSVNKVFVAANTFLAMGDTLAFLPPPPASILPVGQSLRHREGRNLAALASASPSTLAAASASDALPSYSADQKLASTPPSRSSSPAGRITTSPWPTRVSPSSPSSPRPLTPIIILPTPNESPSSGTTAPTAAHWSPSFISWP